MGSAGWGAVGAALVSVTTFVAPLANAANPIGNFDLIIPGRFDFHTWVWSVSPCVGGASPPQCIHVFGIARPIAKAFNYAADAHLVDDRYTLTVDDPYGLRCGDVYYVPPRRPTTSTPGMPPRWPGPSRRHSTRAATVLRGR